MISNMRRFYYSIAMLLLVVQVSLKANVNDNINEQIKEHQTWVDNHVPLPDTLTQERLFIETARAINTSCKEKRFADIIKYAGEKYTLRELVEYSDIRYNQLVDKDDSLARKSLKLLLEKSKTANLPSAYATAYINMYIVLTAPEQEEQTEWIKNFYDITKELYENKNNPRNEELWLFAQFLQESGSFFQRYENPLAFEKCRKVSTDITKFYAKTHITSEIRAYAYETIDRYFSKSQLFPNYQAYINKKLSESNDSILMGKIPLSYLTEEDTEDLLSDTIDYTGAAVKILEKCYHPFHPDVIGMKTAYFQAIFDKKVVSEDDIIQISNYNKLYYGLNSIEYVTANSLLRSSRVWKQDFNETDFNEDLEFTSSFLSGESTAYLNILERELSTQVFCGQTKQALYILRSINEITKKKYSNNIIKELSFHGLDWYFQKQGIAGYETAFDDICQAFVDNCDNYINFETIGLGKTLANTAQTIFNDPTTTLALQRKILHLLQNLVGKHHPLFSFEYIQYGQLVASAYPVDAITLEGDNDEKALFSDIINIARSFECADFAMLAAGRRMSMKGDFPEARAFFNQAIYEIEKKNNSQLTDEEKESNRYYFAGLYSNILQTYFADQTMTDSMDYYGKKLIEQFKNGFEFNPNIHSDIYSALITYYMSKNQYHDAENLLNKCMEYYNANPNSSVDGFYVQLMQVCIQLYGNVYSDMDKCLLLAEKMEKDIEKIKDFGNAETYIGLLRTLYDLVEYKNPYDLLMLSKYLLLLDNAIQHYVQTSKNEMVLYNHGLYLFTKLVRFARDEPQYRAMALVNSSEEQYNTFFWQPLKKNLIENIMPKMVDMKEQIENMYPLAYRQSPIYQQIILNLAICAQRCLDDVKQAEKYYILLSECNAQMGGLHLGNFYLETNDVEKAAHIFSLCEDVVMQYDNGTIDGFYAGQRAQVYSRFCIAYYRAGEYEKALNAANIYYDNIQSQINTNFDLYTQNEREAFLMQYGAGGTPLQYLLPHLGDRISSKVYDVILQEKGLLLRASEKIRESIFASGNDALVHAIDSLHAYQQELSLMADVPESQSRAIELREKYDKLERYITRESKPYRKKDADAPNWKQVRGALKKGEAAIEFVVTDSVSMALVITPDSDTPKSVKLMQYHDMKAFFDKVMSNQDNMSELAVQLYKDDEMHLYEKIWKPIEGYLDGIQTVFYSPSGILNVLSFAAIPLPNGKNLIDKYELHQLTTTGLLANRGNKGKRESKRKNAKLFGAIFYSEEQRTNENSFISEIRSQKDHAELLLAEAQRGAGDIMEEFPFPFLGNTLIECDVVTDLLKRNGFEVEESVGEIPTESEIRKLDGNSPNIIHISTHGFFISSIEKANRIPFFKRFNQLNSMICSGLLLANSEKTWLGDDLDLNDNNLLSASEISTMNLGNTDLIVLSACETALGSLGTEGVFGLQRGFKQAGVKSICASLWSVDDLSTSQLMQLFYDLWLYKYKGREMQKAMREAMIQQRTNTPSPENWAPFVLYDADL